MTKIVGFVANGVVQNAFSDKLRLLGFSLFDMLVVDLLHEFELGVWKAVLTHLLRMLESLEESKIHELDRRYMFHPNVLNSIYSRLYLDTAKSRHLGGTLFAGFLEMSRK